MKKSWLYLISGFPRNLSDLLDKAKKEGERKLHIITEYFETYETVKSINHWTEGYINVRYWHGKDMRLVSLERFDSRRKLNYSSRAERVEEFRKLIESKGFEVATISEREWKNGLRQRIMRV